MVCSNLATNSLHHYAPLPMRLRRLLVNQESEGLVALNRLAIRVLAAPRLSCAFISDTCLILAGSASFLVSPDVFQATCSKNWFTAQMPGGKHASIHFTPVTIESAKSINFSNVVSVNWSSHFFPKSPAQTSDHTKWAPS